MSRIKEDLIRKLVRELIKQELDEANSTASVGGSYNTPHAFGGSNKKGKGKGKAGYTGGHDEPTDGTGHFLADDPKLRKESISESGILYKAGVKKYGKEGMKKIQQAAGKRKSHAEIGAIKDKYEKESLELDEGGMGILDTDQADVLQAIVMRNKNKNTKAILNVALKSGHFKGVDKKELLGYIDGARQFVKYMKSHPTWESINEGRYHAWRNDESLSPKQKIGMAMRETRDNLTELERVVRYNVRLKNELKVDSRDYWKTTHTALSKISERLVRLANKVGQLH